MAAALVIMLLDSGLSGQDPDGRCVSSTGIWSDDTGILKLDISAVFGSKWHTSLGTARRIQ